jgi:hypothetical protein
MDERDKLRILDEVVISEILSLSESELRSRASQSDLAMANIAFEKACTTIGKATLAEAKAALALMSAGAKMIPGQSVAPHLALFRSSNANHSGQMTKAARNQTSGQHVDQAGIDEDIAELKAWASKDKNV